MIIIIHTNIYIYIYIYIFKILFPKSSCVVSCINCMLPSVHLICYLHTNLSSDTYENARQKCRKAEDRISDLGTTDDATKRRYILYIFILIFITC